MTEEKRLILEGFYGSFEITNEDKIEVKKYRLSVLICGVSLCAGLFHWMILGPYLAWIWLIFMATSLGLALNWIHIYIRIIHNALKISWLVGCLGIAIMTIALGIENILPNLRSQPNWIIALGPLFVSLTGLGFKEFFCFRRAEAFGLTIILPIALLGHLSHLLNESTVFILISISSILLLILSIRKFNLDPAADIGDKSVFEYLDKQRKQKVA